MNEDSLPSYETYLELHNGIGNILSAYPRSHANFDYSRAIKAREGYQKWLKGKSLTKEEIKSYFTVSINPIKGSELTKKQYERLQQMYGSSAIKIAMMDGNVKKWIDNSAESERILSTGGGCALESVDTKRIIELSSRDKNLAKKYIEAMFLRFPTWTQITGALIPSRVSIFYDETFPWHLKISEYGITNAELKTQRIYDRLFFTIQRFSKLHNPQNIVLRLPFITLNLGEEGKLAEWSKMYQKYTKEIEKTLGFSHEKFETDSNYKAWIQYTYMGPEILKIALEKIKQEYPKLYKINNLDSYTIHVRGKQLDHFDIERLNLWIHKVLLSKESDANTKQIKKILRNALMREVSAMYMWARDTLPSLNTVGGVGFLDFQYKGKLVHEDRMFSFKEIQTESMKDIFDKLTDSPLRLHSRNLSEVLNLLERFKNPYSVSFSKQMILSMSSLNAKLEQKERKVETLKKYIKYSDIFCGILEKLLNNSPITITETKEKIIDVRAFLIDRYRSEMNLLRLIKDDTKDKRKKMLQIEIQLNNMIKIEKESGKKVIITLKDSELAKAFYDLLKKNNKDDIQRCSEYEKLVEEYTNEIKRITHTISENIVKYESDSLTNHVNILPLADNLFASYMQQFLFIPSIQNAYLDMISIENSKDLSKEEKEKIIVEIINKVYYVIEACLVYIFKNTAYPWEARFESRYERLY